MVRPDKLTGKTAAGVLLPSAPDAACGRKDQTVHAELAIIRRIAKITA